LVNNIVVLAATGLFLTNALTLVGAAATVALVTMGAAKLAPAVTRHE
jgi:hypothetical protein